MPRITKSNEPTVYNRIAVLRADRGWSRQEFADAIGVHYQTVGYLERGEYSPSLVLALRIAALFAVPVEAIFSLEPLEPLRMRLIQTKAGDDNELYHSEGKPFYGSWSNSSATEPARPTV